MGQTAKDSESVNDDEYVVALVVDDKGDARDYHWYRQNPDGTWSHKPGWGLVTNKDAGGNVITDPQNANRNYGPLQLLNGKTDTLDYSTWGGYFAVPKKGIPVD